MCYMQHQNSWMLASCFSICRWRSSGLWWEAPWSCSGIGQKQWLLGDQSQTQHVCGCVFLCHQRRQALLRPVCVLYLYTWHFHFSSLPLILIFVTRKPQSQCLWMCVYVSPRTLGFPSGVYVWVQFTFCTQVPHPRFRGSHFSTSYRRGSTSRKMLHYSIMSFCSSFIIYWVWNIFFLKTKKKTLLIKNCCICSVRINLKSKLQLKLWILDHMNLWVVNLEPLQVPCMHIHTNMHSDDIRVWGVCVYIFFFSLPWCLTCEPWPRQEARHSANWNQMSKAAGDSHSGTC